MSARARLGRLLRGAALLLCAGLGYALWVRTTGLAIPCPIRRVTGKLCPGCGVTTLCLALLRLDFASAWEANPVLLILLPSVALLLTRAGIRYVREGDPALEGWEKGLAWSLVAVLTLWGVVRNLI